MIIWTDRKTRVVVCASKAVPLSIIEFALFIALKDARQTLTTKELVDSIYRGVKEPPLTPVSILHQGKRSLNRKIIRLGCRVETVLRKAKAHWKLVRL